jgi:transposase
MLGPPKARALDRSVLVSPERLVPPNHFYRHLDATLDLSFVRDWVKDCYADRGRPSIDLVVFFRFHLIMFFEGIRSERKLGEMASLNLAHRWYLGYNLDEPLPDRSSLIKIRHRLELETFRRFFEHVLDLCEGAGLIWGKEVLADATKVPGNASMDSLIPRLKEVVDDHLVELFTDGNGADSGKTDEATDDSPPALLHTDLPQGELQPHEDRWDLLETCRLDPDRPPSGPYQRISDRKVSRTDPDACAMAMRDGRTVLGYQDHYLVDGGRARIILHALVTPGDVKENQPFLDQLRRVLFRRKLQPKRVVADAACGTIENIHAVEDTGIATFTPLREWDSSSSGYYPNSAFTYDPEQDVYVCPQGELLRFRGMDYPNNSKQYRARASVCQACPVRQECTNNQQGRLIRRSLYAEYLDRVRSYHETAAYKKAMHKRSIWVEGLFAEAKQWHDLHKFRLRGLANVNIQALLVATGQNLKRWLQAIGWGRRSFPGAARGATTSIW